MKLTEKHEIISVINLSTVIHDAGLEASIPDFQAAVDEDFGPFWGRTRKLVLVRKDEESPPGSWWIVVLDGADEQDLLGCYDLTNEGKPLTKVFAKTAL